MTAPTIARLEEILQFLQAGAAIADQQLEPGSPGEDAARLTQLLAGIAAAAVKAHDQVAEEPLDVTKLHTLPSI